MSKKCLSSLSVSPTLRLVVLSYLWAATASIAGATTGANEVVVTATREAESRRQVPVTIDVIGRKTIDRRLPAHPSEIMSLIPGVHLNVTGGEGHMTAIRQPISTKPLYLYLQDGVPTRSTGFFNHNALYEVNVPQSGGIEVLKGPGTALHGSDAIGAVINVRTRRPPKQPLLRMTFEAGQWGWGRLLLDGGNTVGDDGYWAGVNITHTDGWRDATSYDRQGLTARWDRYLSSGAMLKTVIGFSRIDQQTAGSSRLLRDDYLNNPTMNYTPISYRKVKAFRLTITWEKETVNGLLSIIPYIRDNSMDMLPNWSLSYDPVVYETGHKSVGVLIKHRRNLPRLKGKLISGIDFDYSPGYRDEWQISTTRVGNVYTSYTVGTKLYDYDVSFQAISPYVHFETSPRPHLRLTAGLRYDLMRYDYDNRLSVVTTGSHRRPADTAVTFRHLSPKLGASWQFSKQLNGYVSYRHAFRAPSEGQLFRQGKAIDTVGLDPVKGDNIEVGLRGRRGGLRFEVTLYYLRLRDDILTYRNPDGSRETVNAGRTSHRGIEIGLAGRINRRLGWQAAFSYAKHLYDAWSPKSGVDYSGNEMKSAPRLLANINLFWKPSFLRGGLLTTEWLRVGSYWMDDANTYKYGGHSLVNLRMRYPVGKRLKLMARLMNVTDRRYATTASYKPAGFGPEKFEYSPGMERTLYVGVQYRFR